jgi:hypothetical protein
MSSTAGTQTTTGHQMPSQSTTTAPKSDFMAAEEIKSILSGRDKGEQERILRWVTESLSLAHGSAQIPSAGPAAMNATPANAGHIAQTSAGTVTSSSKDIKSFVEQKKPKNDLQFSAVVAYYHLFEVAEGSRKDTIGSDDLQNAARLSGWRRFNSPVNTLHNAVKQGYLDRADRGQFKLNPVGENLVAMALPGTPETTDSANNRRHSNRRKPNSKRAKTKRQGKP